ncbi:class IV adenylate cyclase [Halosolutus halophilus]|uniref:class IV adenylate cyclase n=1 Tax=Halosolutus halophilus TaxID=1552990 RepID=UPI00223527BB|nr:class IV adenylate cyclase [Halosolutus halophilus]
MYEVEVKVPADLERVRARLDDVGATPTGSVVQEDTYYDAPHRSFSATDEALRIRTERSETGDGGTHITYKGPLVDDESKTREEVETAVGDAEKMDAVLTNLGFEAAATVRKERERFALDEYTITLDSVDDVGEYVEVETEVADERALESAREGAYDVLERLGLDPDDQLRTSYLELLLEA